MDTMYVKRIHFLVQPSRYRKGNEPSETKIHPPEQKKKGKSELKYTK